MIFSLSKDGSGGIFPKLWCRTSQTLRSQRLHGGRSGSGKFVFLGWPFYFGGCKIMDALALLLLYLQVKVPLMSEPQGDWFTSQPASPACFCRYLIKVNLKIWKTLSTLMVTQKPLKQAAIPQEPLPCRSLRADLCAGATEKLKIASKGDILLLPQKHSFAHLALK